jgi:RNA polymerase sigma-70 factor (ECF subfamily)
MRADRPPMSEQPLRGTIPAETRLPPRAAPAAAGEPDPDQPALRRAQAGDREAFSSLVHEYQHKVFGFVMRSLRCDRETAADLSQEVFLRAYRGLRGFDGQARFSTWLHKIALNVCISDYRARRTQKRGRWTFSLDAPIAGTDDLAAGLPASSSGPSDGAYHREIAAAVRAAVDELPDEFRQAVLLRDLQNLSYEEIGEILGVPPGTVRSRIHRGRLILQHKLREYKP